MDFLRRRAFWVPFLFGAVLWLAVLPTVIIGLEALHHPFWQHLLIHHGYYPWIGWPPIWQYPAAKTLAAQLGGAGLLGWGYLRAKDTASREDDPLATAWATKGSVSYGSARWRKGREWQHGLSVVPHTALTPPPSTPPETVSPQPALGGIVCGRQGKQAVLATGDLHTLLIGVPGVGKTRRIILPTIAWCAAGGEALVLGDPKGELASWTTADLTARGYAVLRFDLRQPALSRRWNPLAPVIAAMQAGQWATASRQAWTIAHALVGQQPLGADNQLWSNTSETLIAALVLAVADGVQTGLTPDQQHLFSAYHILMTHAQGTALDQWFDATFPDRHPAKEAYAMIRTAAAETRQSIYVTATATLRLFADPEIAWLTAAQDPAWPLGRSALDIVEQLTQKPFAIFLVIPDEDSTRYPLATLFLTQLIQTLVDAANVKGRLPRRVTFLLDEFGNLPPIPDFEKALTVGRGRGLRFLLAVQALQQLRDQYDKKAEILSGTCQLWLYLGTADPDTAETLSKKCGQKTIQTQSTAQTLGTGGARSVTDTYTSRALVTADEILRWPVGKVLVLQQPGAFPGVLPAPDLSQWPIAKLWQPAPDTGATDLNQAVLTIPRYGQAKQNALGQPLERPALKAGWREAPLDDVNDGTAFS
ncbi:type IV secretion system protein VirD4 [Sulfobacillus thermosulfidooxidans DSM 9293]|uniref:Type IV secretion system protein VirD4 n=1 Tax=Sulfobacillus thermosulfidooxidans (strain DSM 9293 / VKM B-1269 / AT-1) TaxID=929705 RepID=A0A1W1WPG1_SULTA|nr:type IV secretory system conjugative DNA transfer family protein [Sulfobacillus thermosulfidooxidans]SMC08198.1 type IV secretion system protein VirD4 [Sulfobacillus thermosulfidooxidans DSM 9293]